MRRLMLFLALLTMSVFLSAGSVTEVREQVETEQGERNPLRYYADSLYYGRGVERNPYKALELYKDLVDGRSASDDDRAWSAYQLGKAYAEGIHVRRDRKLSGLYYRLAVSLGSEEAEEALTLEGGY